jgi:hypothetical protein
MINEPMDITRLFPVRRKNEQKAAFRDAVQDYFSNLGYSVAVEENKKGCYNIVIGDASSAQYLITAHYDTPATSLFPNFYTPNNLVLYFAYQMLLVFAYMAIAFVVCVIAGLIYFDKTVIFLAWYISYMALAFSGRYGPANRNNWNDNTSGIVTLLETARTMPENQRHKVAFILFDQEELGLVGSKAYRKAHKEQTENQTVLNLDCVGDGDEIRIFPSKTVKADETAMNWLSRICGRNGPKQIKLKEKGTTFYPSDQKNFPRGVAIAAFRVNKWCGLYHGRIHTNRDTVLDQTNVNILRAALTTLICQ